MTAPLGIILVHGYLGTPSNLSPLAAALACAHNVVECVCLPGHDAGPTPVFDESAFLAEIACAIDRQLAAGRNIVMLGHSTGGNLVLVEIARRLAADPESLAALHLLVLCATPPRIDLGYAKRWAAHTVECESRMDDVGALVGLVNRLARQAPLALPAPVLIVHGEADELVPVDDADLWRSNRLTSAQRHNRIPDARHHLFTGPGAAMAIDVIRLAIEDAGHRQSAAIPPALRELVPEMDSFCAVWPDSARHLHQSPAGRRALAGQFAADPAAAVQPSIANIEITTRCGLGCAACARTQQKLKSRHMSRDNFRRVLAQLPHAWRIMLVGLGEPLMHPQVIDCIQIAVGEGRRVGLVTNAMLLNAEMARELCASGLSGITFSLDAIDQATADQLRSGSDMQQIRANIRGFMAERRRQGSQMNTSVFTALSQGNIDEFAGIVDFVAEQEIDALMVTDLNFSSNQERSLNRTFSLEYARKLRQGLKQAVTRRLPVLSVLGLEEFALAKRYLEYLLLRGEPIAQRSARHRHCLSPWQSIPVNVDGNLTMCDCQPEAVIGNLHRDPISHWWNGPTMLNHRHRMLGDNPPEACLVCPRF